MIIYKGNFDENRDIYFLIKKENVFYEIYGSFRKS